MGKTLFEPFGHEFGRRRLQTKHVSVFGLIIAHVVFDRDETDFARGNCAEPCQFRMCGWVAIVDDKDRALAEGHKITRHICVQ